MNTDRIQYLLNHLGDFGNHLRPRSHATEESLIPFIAGLAIGAAGMYLYSNRVGNAFAKGVDSRTEGESGPPRTDDVAGIYP